MFAECPRLFMCLCRKAAEHYKQHLAAVDSAAGQRVPHGADASALPSLLPRSLHRHAQRLLQEQQGAAGATPSLVEHFSAI